jgi:lipopolysaccharide biosynthesis glycosyltransferase
MPKVNAYPKPYIPLTLPSLSAPRMAGKICITTTYDRKYIMGGDTLFKSIKHHTDCTEIDFKVITADMEVVKHVGIENCHFITDEIKARYANVKYIPELANYGASWNRFEMFNFEGYDRVICIDSDCLCLNDMSYLFSEELNEYDLISVEDHVVSKGFTRCMPQLEKQGLNFTGLRRRLAAGDIDIQPALLVANKSIVNKSWYDRLMHYANTTEFTYSIDEGILNDFVYLDKLRIKLLPLEYDYQDLYEVHYPALPVPTNPIIVHCEVTKPFRMDKAKLNKQYHKWHDKWWEESRCTEEKSAVPTSSIVPISSLQTSRGVLDDLAIKYKADKCSLYHNFAVKYDRLLSGFRDSFTNILEIGVALGQSLRMWVDYFPNATVHGVDNYDGSRICESYSKRIKFHLLDQGNAVQLKKLEPFGPFNLILDDGNHFWREQILSFQTLFPFVKPGGIYIIEDTCTSYWKKYNNNPVSCVDYFKKLVDDVNLNGAKGRVPNNPSPDFISWKEGFHRREDCHDNLPEFDTITFMNSLIVVKKRR